MTELYIGLMSGTSLDGVDAVLMTAGGPTTKMSLHGHVHKAFSLKLRRECLALNSAGNDEIARSALVANEISQVYAQAVAQLLLETTTAASALRAIGAHGQTVRHRPGEFDTLGYTVQLINGALLAELSGIDVICDFRSRDIAAAGQGAPLVPGFHASVFARPGIPQAILNLGGIANITLLDGLHGVRGFDCGPGNTLLDAWCERHTGQAYDDEGRWAASGKIDATLLELLRADPFFRQPPPKSTGRDLFNTAWLEASLQKASANSTPPQAADVQATLAELTVLAAADAIREHLPQAHRVVVCGGGALNTSLMQGLALSLPTMEVIRTEAEGIPAMQVEAAAFAWLAHAFTHRLPGNCPDVTGATGGRILGCLYPR